MPLAGNMKLKHFLLAIGGVGILGCAGLWAIADVVFPPSTVVDSSSSGAAPSKQMPTSSGQDSSDQVALSWKGRTISSKKQKDVSAGKAFKINVYQDAGKSSVNRLKIDLDRDDKWDEKWTFKGDKVSRKKSSKDDESYDLNQEWNGESWQ